jgi:hypothetical protein
VTRFDPKLKLKGLNERTKKKKSATDRISTVFAFLTLSIVQFNSHNTARKNKETTETRMENQNRPELSLYSRLPENVGITAGLDVEVHPPFACSSWKKTPCLFAPPNPQHTHTHVQSNSQRLTLPQPPLQTTNVSLVQKEQDPQSKSNPSSQDTSRTLS